MSRTHAQTPDALARSAVADLKRIQAGYSNSAVTGQPFHTYLVPDSHIIMINSDGSYNAGAEISRNTHDHLSNHQMMSLIAASKPLTEVMVRLAGTIATLVPGLTLALHLDDIKNGQATLSLLTQSSTTAKADLKSFRAITEQQDLISAAISLWRLPLIRLHSYFSPVHESVGAHADHPCFGVLKSHVKTEKTAACFLVTAESLEQAHRLSGMLLPQKNGAFTIPGTTISTYPFAFTTGSFSRLDPLIHEIETIRAPVAEALEKEATGDIPDCPNVVTHSLLRDMIETKRDFARQIETDVAELIKALDALFGETELDITYDLVGETVTTEASTHPLLTGEDLATVLAQHRDVEARVARIGGKISMILKAWLPDCKRGVITLKKTHFTTHGITLQIGDIEVQYSLGALDNMVAYMAFLSCMTAGREDRLYIGFNTTWRDEDTGSQARPLMKLRETNISIVSASSHLHAAHILSTKGRRCQGTNTLCEVFPCARESVMASLSSMSQAVMDIF